MKPVLFTIGSFNVYAFGLFLALSFLLSTFLVWRLSREELKEEEYLDAYFLTNIAGLAVARFFYIIMHPDEFQWNVLRYIVVRETPGLSLLGGILGGVGFLIWYAKKKKHPLVHLLDLFSVAVSFAFVFAKLGEQLGGAGFGKESTGFLAITIVGKTQRYHPVELYEAVAWFVVFLLLRFVYIKVRSKHGRDGTVVCLFTLGMAIIVFCSEFFKEAKLGSIGLSFRQIAAIVLFAAGSFPLLKKTSFLGINVRGKKGGKKP